MHFLFEVVQCKKVYNLDAAYMFKLYAYFMCKNLE